MKISDMAQTHGFDVNLFFTGKSKSKETAGVLESRFTPVDTPFTAPNWNKIPTKGKPKMSDDDFENAIRELARKEASQGILAGTEEKSQLRHDYISVVSPDRKAIYNESMAKTGGKMNSTYSFFDQQGNKSFHYNTQAGMWFTHTTAAENARREKFTEIYMDEFTKYEAEYGKVVGTPTVKHFNAFG